MAKIPGAHTKLSAEISTTMTLITQRVSITGPTQNVSTLEVSDLDSTRREYVPLLPDSGTLTCQLWFDPNDTVHKQLQDWLNVPALQTWEIEWACTPVVKANFDGFLTSFSIGGMDVDGYLTCDMEIQISGDVTFTTTP